MSSIKIFDVFKTNGHPTATYVSRNKGLDEKLLTNALCSNGDVCMLIGPSKTGKTTLYNRVLDSMNREPIVIRSNDQLSINEFWTKALEKVDFDRISSRTKRDGTDVSGEAKLKGELGWKWLAKIIGEVSLGVKKSMGESEVREKILAKPSPEHLLPALKSLPITLVVEDFQYLNEGVKKTLSQQWKMFSDEEVSIVVVGTTHHAISLAKDNTHLIGRMSEIELDRWSTTDLEQIIDQGFSSLSLTPSAKIKTLISNESAGLPIITQGICRQLFIDREIYEYNNATPLHFNHLDVYKALHNVAITSYSHYKSMYSKLINGPRKRSRKYDTYELILSVFTQDPLVFSLKRHEIDERLDNMNISMEKKPPQQSINSTLNALAAFQKNSGLELLEWVKGEKELYVVEPGFLFYIRWREERSNLPTETDVLKALFSTIAKFDSIFNLK